MNRIQKSRILRNEDSLRVLWDNIKHANIHILGIAEGQKREKGAENLFEVIIAENFPNLGKETDIQVQEAESPKQDELKEVHNKTHYN